MTAQWAFAARPALSAGCDGPDETLRQTLGPDGLAWGDEPTFGQGTDSWPPTLLTPTLLTLDLLRKTDPISHGGGHTDGFRALPPQEGLSTSDAAPLRLHLEYWQLQLLRDFDQLLCLEGLSGVEHLPHQIETVRKVLRRFRGRVLLADEVGLGKTIEACLLLREYLLRGLAKRVLILVPTTLVSQWREELASKFHLEFSTPPCTGAADRPDYWEAQIGCWLRWPSPRAASGPSLVTEVPWDLVIVDEAHHCKNRATQNWRLVNALKRRHLFLLSATPVQNNLLEFYNLLTLLEPGHLKTENRFQAAIRSPRQSRATPQPRAVAVAVGRGDHAQHAEPGADRLAAPLRADDPGPAAGRRGLLVPATGRLLAAAAGPVEVLGGATRRKPGVQRGRSGRAAGGGSSKSPPAGRTCERRQERATEACSGPAGRRTYGRRGMPTAGAAPIERAAVGRGQSRRGAGAVAGKHRPPATGRPTFDRLARAVGRTAKEERFVEPAATEPRGKDARLRQLSPHARTSPTSLTEEGVPFATYSGAESESQKDAAVAAFRDRTPVMLCSEIGRRGTQPSVRQHAGELRSALEPHADRAARRPHPPHRPDARRVHFQPLHRRLAGGPDSGPARREDPACSNLVVGKVGSILGNLQGGEEFESLVLDLWLRSHDQRNLQQSFDSLGQSLLDAQEKYVRTKQLDEALFGEGFHDRKA